MINYANMTRNLFCKNPVLESRINNGIELYRKGACRLKLADKTGVEIKHAEVRYKQIRHEFKFGCNAFLMDAFDSDEKNALAQPDFC